MGVLKELKSTVPLISEMPPCFEPLGDKCPVKNFICNEYCVCLPRRRIHFLEVHRTKISMTLPRSYSSCSVTRPFLQILACTGMVRTITPQSTLSECSRSPMTSIFTIHLGICCWPLWWGDKIFQAQTADTLHAAYQASLQYRELYCTIVLTPLPTYPGVVYSCCDPSWSWSRWNCCIVCVILDCMSDHFTQTYDYVYSWGNITNNVVVTISNTRVPTEIQNWSSMTFHNNLYCFPWLFNLPQKENRWYSLYYRYNDWFSYKWPPLPLATIQPAHSKPYTNFHLILWHYKP